MVGEPARHFRHRLARRIDWRARVARPRDVDDAALVRPDARARGGGGAMIVAQVLWQSPTLLPAAIATLGVMLATLLWLYPPQVRELPRPWRWLPTGLRAMAITALVVSLLQPAVLRPRTISQQGTIAVLVD